MVANFEHDGGSRGGMRILGWALLPLLLLLVPLVAMQFTAEVVWDETDFIVMGVVLATAGTGYALATHKAVNFPYKAGAALAVGTAFFLVWSSLAVGIIGDGRYDVIYLGVLAVLIAGTILARFRPEGMVRAAAAAAGAHAFIVAIALASGWQNDPGSSVGEILAVNAMFVLLFLGSAGLFHWAARTRAVAAREA